MLFEGYDLQVVSLAFLHNQGEAVDISTREAALDAVFWRCNIRGTTLSRAVNRENIEGFSP